MSEYDALVTAAAQAFQNACAPISNFRVGAAVRAKSGRIFTGCNIENATLSTAGEAERGVFDITSCEDAPNRAASSQDVISKTPRSASPAVLSASPSSKPSPKVNAASMPSP